MYITKHHRHNLLNSYNYIQNGCSIHNEIHNKSELRIGMTSDDRLY